MVLLQAQLSFLKETLLPLSDRIVTAVVLIIVGLIVGRIAAKVTQKLLRECHLNETLEKLFSIRFSVEELFALLLRYFVYLVFVMLALNTLGLASLLLESVAILILLFITLSGLLALKDFIPNFFAGLRLQHLLHEGDQVTVEEIIGTVKKLTLTHVFIVTKSKDLITIPNVFLLKHPFKRKKA